LGGSEPVEEEGVEVAVGGAAVVAVGVVVLVSIDAAVAVEEGVTAPAITVCVGPVSEG
jgi:hypothetical protein